MANQVECTSEMLSYIREVSFRDDDLLSELRELTADLPGGASMQVMAEEGQLLALLAGLVSARTVVEVGTFTGYSTLCLARAVPPDGLVVTCDITDRWPSIGMDFWQRAGVRDRIDLRIGPAAKTLVELRSSLGENVVDLAFIDADKAGYPAYYEALVPLVRPNGLIVVDNTLFFGRVLDPTITDLDTLAVRELNNRLRDDSRVEISLLPMADGITLIRKR